MKTEGYDSPPSFFAVLTCKIPGRPPVGGINRTKQVGALSGGLRLSFTNCVRSISSCVCFTTFGGRAAALLLRVRLDRFREPATARDHHHDGNRRQEPFEADRVPSRALKSCHRSAAPYASCARGYLLKINAGLLINAQAISWAAVSRPFLS